jgi:hypothetical protein
MGYSSDLTDKEWEIIEPLLPQKRKLDHLCGQRDNSSMAYFISSRTVVIGETYPEIYHHIQLSSGTIRTGVKMAVSILLSETLRERIMAKLHLKAREQVKKTRMDNPDRD